MTGLEELAPERRALLELLLARAHSYASVGEVLGISKREVEGLAHAALDELTPVTSRMATPEERGLIADYLLGQGSPQDRAYVERMVGRAGGPQSWAGSVLDSLASLYPTDRHDDLAAVLAGSHKAAKRGRRLPAALGAAALALVAVTLVLTGAFGGDDGHGKAAKTPTATSTQTTASTTPATTLISSGRFSAAKGERASGGAAIYRQGDKRALVVQSQLKPGGKNDVYEVWFFNSASDAKPAGAQAADSKGRFQGQASVPTDYARYRAIVISRERAGTNPKQPSNIVAAAELKANG